jgi:transposase
MVRHIELFQAALGLESPWYVVRYEFSPQARRLDLYIDFEAGAVFACPVCGRAGCKAHDTSEKSWRHLNFFQYEAYLHARVPRVRCPEHGVKAIEVPWARPGSGFTLLFEAFVLALVQDMPVNAAARIVGEHDTLIWRIMRHYVNKARAAEDFSSVRQLGIDETSSKRGQNYVSLFVDLERSKVLFATEGRDAHTLARFRSDLEAHGGMAERLAEICMDMSAAFIKGAAQNFPLAEVTYDKFHIMKIMNEAVDQVRRDEQKTRPELTGSRYVWLKNQRNWTARQHKIFQQLSPPKVGLKTARAYQIKLALQEFWTLPPSLAEVFLQRWYFLATHSRLDPVIRAARTIKRHWDGVLRWFTSRVSNGVLEAVNSLVQAAKARARGYRNVENFITMIYLIAGKLQLCSPT